MKILNAFMRVLFGLILLLPVLGTTGVFPEPTADMYTPEGWAFMQGLMSSGYMMPMLGITCGVGLLLNLFNRTALAAVIMAPFTVNVILFHVFLDAAPISASAIPGYILLVTNAYFLWVNRSKYKPLW